MKLLSIGNSFSQDAHNWLHRIAIAAGVELETVNLYIGGCDLATHCGHMTDEDAAYEFEINGNIAQRMVTLTEALESDTYDVITLQQASHDSGHPQTYVPYLEQLAAFCREKQPTATLYFHETWAYEEDSDHGAFPQYHNSRWEMATRVQDAVAMACKLVDAKLLPVGSVIHALRETAPAFNYSNGGLSLCRDGFHLSYDYGRFAAAATWLRVLMGVLPPVDVFPEVDPLLLSEINHVVEQVVTERCDDM